MRDADLESLVRSQFDFYVRVAWLVCGDRSRAAESVSAGFKSAVTRPAPRDLDVRKATVRAALKSRVKGMRTNPTAVDRPLSIGREELAALVAVDWAGLTTAKAARLMRLSGRDFAALYSRAAALVEKHPNETLGKAVARLVRALANELPSESLVQRNALLDEINQSRPKSRKWAHWAVVGLTLVAVVAVGIWVTRDRDQAPPKIAAQAREGNAAAPTSLDSSEEVAKWATASCKRPRGDYEALEPKDVAGKLQSGSSLKLSGPMTSVNDQMVSLLLTSPVNNVARFCFAVTRGDSPSAVDWYVYEVSPSQVQGVVTIKPSDVGLLVVVGGDETSPFVGGEPTVECPEASVTSQTVTEVSALGAGLWQATCGVAPDPGRGVMTVISGGTDASSQQFEVDQFTEVPLTETLAVKP